MKAFRCHTKVILRILAVKCIFKNTQGCAVELAVLPGGQFNSTEPVELAVLPGGQFCERERVLHLPVDLSDIVHQLPLDQKESDQISVSYENGHVTVLSKHKVSPFKLFHALHWLKANTG